MFRNHGQGPPPAFLTVEDQSAQSLPMAPGDNANVPDGAGSLMERLAPSNVNVVSSPIVHTCSGGMTISLSQSDATAGAARHALATAITTTKAGRRGLILCPLSADKCADMFWSMNGAYELVTTRRPACNQVYVRFPHEAKNSLPFLPKGERVSCS